MTPTCNPRANPGCDKPVACDFDPDGDGYARDFYVELKNKPGCVTKLGFVSAFGQAHFLLTAPWRSFFRMLPKKVYVFEMGAGVCLRLTQDEDPRKWKFPSPPHHPIPGRAKG